MLKKAGIVVAASAAGLLAVGGFAFASDNGDNEQHGLVNLQNTNAQVPVQACNNSVAEGTLGILAKDQTNKDKHNGKCKQNNEANN